MGDGGLLCAAADPLRRAGANPRDPGDRAGFGLRGLDSFHQQADLHYLFRICLHLLSNALRACPPGTGRVTVTLRACAGKASTISFTDTGCGLPDAGRLDSLEENRRHFLGGTQTGLLLCREYCRLMGWTLEIRPRARSRGTEAILTIPQRNVFDPYPTLRSYDEEDAIRDERQLWLDLVLELSCVPGLESAKFKIPPKYT